MSSQTVTPDVFISYSRVEIDTMRRLRDLLHAGGLTVWTDENLEAGTENWIDAIQRALDHAPCVVVLMSPDAKRSEWVKREIEYAGVLERRIFPVLLSGSKRDAVPLPLITMQYADFTNGFEKPFQQLQKSVHAFLKKPIITPEPPKTETKREEPVVTTSTDELPIIGQQLVFQPPSAALLRFQRFAPFIIFAALLYFVWTNTGTAFQSRAISNILTTAAVPGMVAVGLSLVILTGGIDLSVGGIAGVTSVIAGLAYRDGSSILVMLGVSLLAGTLIGWLQGTVIARLRMGSRLQLTASPVAGLIPSLLVTLFTFYLLQYVPYILTEGQSIFIEDEFIRSLTSSPSVPALAIIFVVVTVIVYVVLQRTPIGSQFAQIRSDPYAAFKQKIRVQRIIGATFAVTGFLSAIGGLLLVARIQSSNPQITGIELQALGAFMLGGNSLFVNRGNLLRVILGAINVSLLSNAALYLRMVSGWSNIILLILIAVFVVVDYLTIPQARAVQSRVVNAKDAPAKS